MRRRAADEGGAVTIIVALSLMVLLTGLALSIDIGALRADRRSEQSTSDFAALAAANDLDPLASYDPIAACQAAWDYAVANLVDAPNDAPSRCASDFAQLASLPRCTASTPESASVAEAGHYVITITTPVLDGSPLMQGRVDGDVDGWSCERLGVTIERSRDHLIAGTFGDDSGTTRASAVVRAFSIGQTGQFASLIVLDRTGCDVLLATGQGTVVVDEYVDLEGNVTPGIVTVDTVGGTCAANQNFAIDATGQQNSRICVGTLALNLATGKEDCTANGNLFSHGLRVGFQQDFVSSHDPCDIEGAPCNSSGIGRLAPEPVPGVLVTRSPGDHRYNCNASYPVVGSLPDVPLQYPSNPIKGCEETTLPHVDNLVATLGGTGTEPGGGLDWNTFPDDLADPVTGTPLYSCSENVLPIVIPSGNWWINCPSGNNNPGFRPNVPVAFQDPGVIVFEEGLDIRGGSITVGDESTDDAIMFVREGDVTFSAQSTVDIWNTFIYLHDGTLTSGAGSPLRRFVAPSQGMQDCVYTTGLPDPACFEDLILWSNSSEPHTLAGQGLLDIQGVFFTPNATPFELKGDSNQTLDKAQFISHRIQVSGQGKITMRPNPEFNLEADLTGGGLIR